MSEKVYFLSDSHLGIPDNLSSLAREKKMVAWLDMVKKDASAIYLMGDIFDFWFEYRRVVPKGYVRLLGKLAELSDASISIHYFTGNHDMWAFDYFEKEIGVIMHHEPLDTVILGKRFHLSHGDGLGPGDRGYKFLKAVFSCRFCQRLFAALHPATGMRLANYFSRKSRLANRPSDEQFLGEDKEWLVIYSKELLKKRHVDYFVYGHRHVPVNIEIAPGVRYINTGDWYNHYSYAVFDGSRMELLSFTGAPHAEDH